MKPKRPYGSCAVLCAALLAIVSLCGAQESDQRPAEHRGVPQDWSQRHVVFTRAGLAQYPDLMEREPRIRHARKNAFHRVAQGQEEFRLALGQINGNRDDGCA